MKYKMKIFSGLIFTLCLLMMFVISCSPKAQNTTNGIITHTPTITMTPTCAPISLSTPEGWVTDTNLYVILYDPRSVGEETLTFENRETTQDIPDFIQKIVPKFLKPGDQISIFQLGYSSYEAARVSRQTSYTTVPPLYNTPSPNSTLTPVPTPTIVGGFGPVQATNQAKIMQTQRAAIEEQVNSEYNCQKKYWNDNVGATAAIWDVTATAEVLNLNSKLKADFDQFLQNMNAIEEPFRTNELYYGGVYNGLSFATRVFQSDGTGCAKYTTCTLIIIDDLETWKPNNPDNLNIDLHGVNIYAILPNCWDMDTTACKNTRSYWDSEFKEFGASVTPTYWNGERAEINLLNEIGR
ncbi:MAG: hypothetical protein LC099_07745 [Anaerolineales bacterium]|nr:hypothetical protein [Anaerolineales bacterium]